MYQICVSGSSKGESVNKGRELAMRAGEAVAKEGHTLLTGATIGLPHYAAVAYKKAGGKNSIGISPATSKIEHATKYRLPLEPYDAIFYTGMHYVGRDSLLITSCDAVLSIGGRLGTLHEATIAIQTETPIALLQNVGGTSGEIMDILKAAGREPSENIILGDDPVELLNQLVALLDRDHKKYRNLF